jgi:hypothetical protein
MQHPIEIISGEWQGRTGVYVEGAVIVSGTDKLYLSDVMTVFLLDAIDGKVQMVITATKWTMTILATPRVYQLFKQYATISIRQGIKNSIVYSQARAQESKKTSCCGGK